MNKKQYLEYIGHFNNKRYDSLISYFSPDITVEFYTNWKNPETPPRTFHGAKQFIGLYKVLHGYAREILELRDFLTDGNLLAAELYTEFHCFKDSPPDAYVPLKKDDIRILTNWVIYDLTNDNKMKRIRIAHFRMHDPKGAKF